MSRKKSGEHIHFAKGGRGPGARGGEVSQRREGSGGEVSQRRALTNLGGKVHLQGTRASAEPLREVLEGLGEVDPDTLTHSFHTYPGRIHPAVPRRLLHRFANPGQVVLDPFVGSGTTLVEAMVYGCAGVGTDINPIALRIAAVRTLRWERARIDRFVSLGLEISEAAFSDARRRVSRPLSRAARLQVQWFAPHVLQELMALDERVSAIPDEQEREVARMVFSSILVKVSQQRSDSDMSQVGRQIGRGTSSRLFGRRSVELGEQLRALAEAVLPSTPSPVIRRADARSLPGPDASVDIIITSPPYAGTYDYVRHQERRFSWLEENPDFAVQHEIGARRSSQNARERWIRDEEQVLCELARVLKPGGLVFLLAGDGLLEGAPYFIDREIDRVAAGAGLSVLGIASQDRAHFSAQGRHAFGETPRREHLIYLKKRLGMQR